MDARAHLFGVRHHGPGSAASLVAGLDRLDPAAVLIEGPSDANDLLSFAALPGMQPPVALLVHAVDEPARASFFPFAAFSPEWRALLWAADRAHRTSRPRPADIDWPRTIRANLQRYQPELQTVIPERLIGYRRRSRARIDVDSFVLCVDQSGSMATSVVRSSIFAAVMATLPVITNGSCASTRRSSI
jgi:hypothetical protein